MHSKLLVGLGNPGEQYKLTRHNVGQMLIDRIAPVYNFPTDLKKHNSLISNTIIGDYKVYKVKPLSFMNNSGNIIAKIANFYSISSENVIVIHDDLDLEFAKIKIKNGGSDGGHNGLKSINQYLKNNYNRIRLGIGRPLYKNMVSSFVLNEFSKEEKAYLDELFYIIAKYFYLVINNEIGTFFNKLLKK